MFLIFKINFFFCKYTEKKKTLDFFILHFLRLSFLLIVEESPFQHNLQNLVKKLNTIVK